LYIFGTTCTYIFVDTTICNKVLKYDYNGMLTLGGSRDSQENRRLFHEWHCPVGCRRWGEMWWSGLWKVGELQFTLLL